MQPITLYQFPISHYCEKVRWALDYKGVPHQIKNLLPGKHIEFAKSVAQRSSVPILQVGDTYVQQSSAIIDYLDEHFPDKPLTPTDPDLREEALKWEAFADKDLGPHVRRWAYYTLLEHPSVVLPALTTGAPLLFKPMFRFFFPKVRVLMKKAMNIYPDEAQASAVQIDAALAQINEALNGKDFLVGDTFSRADLAMSAMLSPLFMPKQYGVKWPKKMPEPLQGWVSARRDKLVWAEKVYGENR
jgi:glutathione S-transferase